MFNIVTTALRMKDRPFINRHNNDSVNARVELAVRLLKWVDTDDLTVGPPEA